MSRTHDVYEFKPTCLRCYGACTPSDPCNCGPTPCYQPTKKAENLMPPKDTDETIPDLPSPSQAPPGKQLKEVPFLTEAADFSTIAGAAKFWYNQYLEANGARTRIKIVCAVAGMLAGWGAASLWQYLSP